MSIALIPSRTTTLPSPDLTFRASPVDPLIPSHHITTRRNDMAIAFMADIPGLTADQGQQLLNELGYGNGGKPRGQVFHIEGPHEGGLRVVDVWESMDAFNTFAQNELVPAFQRLGLPMPDLQPTTWEVTAILQ
jgi:hypothetical protein